MTFIIIARHYRLNNNRINAGLKISKDNAKIAMQKKRKEITREITLPQRTLTKSYC